MKLDEWYACKGVLGLPKSLELWRWKRLPGNVVMFLKKHNLESSTGMFYRGIDIDLFISEVKRENNVVHIDGLLEPNDRFFTLLRTLGKVSVSRRGILIQQDFRVFVEKSGAFKLSTFSNALRKSLKLFVGVYLRSIHCVKCGLCTQLCPSSSITISKEGVIVDESCLHCSRCNDLCPLVEYVAGDYVDCIVPKLQSSISND